MHLIAPRAETAGRVGNELTLADFYAWEALDAAMRAEPAVLDGFPILRKFVADFASRPKIRRYLLGRGKTARLPHTGGPDKPEAPGKGASYLDGIIGAKEDL